MIGPGHLVRDVCGVLVRKFLPDKILTITKKTEHHKLTAGIDKEELQVRGVLKSSNNQMSLKCIKFYNMSHVFYIKKDMTDLIFLYL